MQGFWKVSTKEPLMRLFLRWCALTTTAAALLVCLPAQADSPPPSWDKERVLNCDGQTVNTYLTPAGFGTPYHLVGSTAVIVPKHVEVIFPGQTEPVTTYDTPGFDKNAKGTADCTYTDPSGLFVHVIGIFS
jgi:hypothetical protein